MKKCSKCRRRKAASCFYRNKARHDGLSDWCSKCNSDNMPKDTWLRHRYGITGADYQLLLKSQGGRCAICRARPTPHRMMPVDHDHKTGKVRGILCEQCNRGLGYLKDSPKLLKKAIHYLQHAAK